MNENKNPIRKTIYIDEELVKKCEILLGEAEANSFSQFVTQALNCYIDKLICENHSTFLTEDLKNALHDEVAPIAMRLSKSLYRYAIEIDMICQILGYAVEIDPAVLELLRKNANRRVAVMRGKIDLEKLLNDTWLRNYLGDDYD